MITSKMMLVAENVIKDTDSNSLSIINILEDISAESFPIVIQRIAIVAYLEKAASDEDKGVIKFRIVNNKVVLSDNLIRADFRGKNKNRTVVRLGGILFQEPGIAKFELLDSQDERLICEYILNLKMREPVSVAQS